MSRPRLSVVIPCFNARERISELLRQLSHQTMPRDHYEIIVVDDGSTDGTPERVRDVRDVILIEQAQGGPGLARNVGAERARGDYVLFMDSDLDVAGDLLERHLEFHLAHPDVAATGGSVVPPHCLPLFSWVLVDHLSSWFNVHPKVTYHEPPEYLPSLNYCIDRRRVLDDHRIEWEPGLEHTGEDVLFCHALRKQGLVIAFVEGAVVKHYDRATLESHLYHMFRWGYHAPFVRGRIPDLKYSFLFPRNPFLLLFTLPPIVLGYTFLIWKSWLAIRALAVTLSLPQILLGRCAYAWGVLRGSLARSKRE